MTLRLGVFATHPIQYLAPLWRRLAAEPGIHLRVHFFSDCSVRGEIDPEFGVPVAWDTPLLEGYESVFLDRTAHRSDFRWAWIPHALRLLRESRFDRVMVHGYTHPFELQLLLAARRLGVGTMMRGEFTSALRPGRSRIHALLRDAYLRWLYRRVDAFCYLGTNGRDHLLSYGVEPARLFFSPHAVDDALLERQRLQYPRESMRRLLGIRPENMAVLFSGKLIPRKAPELLVDAIRRLEIATAIHLIMLGDGPLRSELERAARSVVGGRLTMPGFVNQSQLGRYFSAADVLVLPSQFETWGLVVNEAMQFSLPVLVSDGVGCHGDLVVPGRTGLVFPVGDAAALTVQLQWCWNHPAQRRQMGIRAKSRVAKYSIEASAAGILAALHGGRRIKQQLAA